jgi:hypothetical protein
MDDCLFIKIWKFFYYYFIEYVLYAFILHLFCFIPLTFRFGLLVVSWRSSMFHLYFLIFFLYVYLNIVIVLFVIKP